MPAKSDRQLPLFSPDIVPLRALVCEVHLHKNRVARKKQGYTIGLERSVDNLLRAVEALLNADTVGMRLAGVTPGMAMEWASRLQMAAGALERRKA